MDAMAKHEIKPSHFQTVQLKKMSQAGELTITLIYEMLSERKKLLKGESSSYVSFREFFSHDYSQKRMEAVIISLLSKWKAGAIFMSDSEQSSK